MRHFSKSAIATLKERYPKGTRIELISMEDPFSTYPAGLKGTVRVVDDIGTIHVDWDNGGRLGVISGVDAFQIVDD